MPSSKTRASIEIPTYLHNDLARLAALEKITVTALATRLLYEAVTAALTQHPNLAARTTPQGEATPAR
jgi:hypothetical protein